MSDPFHVSYTAVLLFTRTALWLFANFLVYELSELLVLDPLSKKHGWTMEYPVP